MEIIGLVFEVFSHQIYAESLFLLLFYRHRLDLSLLSSSPDIRAYMFWLFCLLLLCQLKLVDSETKIQFLDQWRH